MTGNTFIFDCEVFAHDWLFVFKEVATGQRTMPLPEPPKEDE